MRTGIKDKLLLASCYTSNAKNPNRLLMRKTSSIVHIYVHVILSLKTTLIAFQQLAHSRSQLFKAGTGERTSYGG